MFSLSIMELSLSFTNVKVITIPTTSFVNDFRSLGAIKVALVEFNTEPDINCNLFAATFSVQLFSIILFFIQIKTDRVSWYRYKSFTCLYSKQLDTGSYISLQLIEI